MDRNCPLKKSTVNYKVAEDTYDSEESFMPCEKEECEWWGITTKKYYDHEQRTELVEGCAIRLIMEKLKG